jgi:anti-sigma factor RsiW
MTDHVTGRLAAYISGQCTPAEAEHISAHLAECTTCRAAHDAHQHTTDDLRFTLQALPSPDLWAGVQAARTRMPHHTPWHRATPLLPVVLLLLSLPLTLPFLAGVGYTAPPVNQSPTPTIIANTLPEATQGPGTLVATRAQPQPDQTVRSLLTPVPQPPDN